MERQREILKKFDKCDVTSHFTLRVARFVYRCVTDMGPLDVSRISCVSMGLCSSYDPRNVRIFRGICSGGVRETLPRKY
jgi:hypothetical protein